MRRMDLTHLQLKEDHESCPLWVTPHGHIYLETFSAYSRQAYDFLIAIAEPVTRPQYIHEYMITPYSLFAAASVGLATSEIIDGLRRLSKVALDPELVEFIESNTAKCGKVKLLLDTGRFYVESSDPDILNELLQDESIHGTRIDNLDIQIYSKRDRATGLQKKVIRREQLDVTGVVFDQRKAMGLESAVEEPVDEVRYHFEIDPAQVETLRKQSADIGYPTLEEYEFRKDTLAGDLPISLKPSASIRPYQEKSLSKMFGNGRARSGIIVLPCGAGKTLVGITATSTIRKNTLVLCNTGVSVKQWKTQFMLWSNIPEKNISLFTSTEKQAITTDTVLLITTYNMLAFSGNRSKVSSEILMDIKSREWGLVILDEVHVAPAKTFRKCLSETKSRCKLGLTATLLREDDKIEDLFFLIGPKLYEANWLALQRDGYLATVQCVEVRCPMTAEFYKEYLTVDPRKRQLLYVMNPQKFRACQYLIDFHEKRGDKVLVFSDIIFALEKYAKILERSFLYGQTSDRERMELLSHLQSDSNFNTLFISKVGDTSIDLPDVNVIIQISSHFSSRRQEAQRLGRILRPKSHASQRFNAFFYTLISEDTAEVMYATKRQTFLIDQGYSFESVHYNDLIDEKDPPAGLKFGTVAEQLKLLAQCKSVDSTDCEIEDLRDEDEHEWIRQRKREIQTAKRRHGMGSLSGGDGPRMYKPISGGVNIIAEERKRLKQQKLASAKRKQALQD